MFFPMVERGVPVVGCGRAGAGRPTEWKETPRANGLPPFTVLGKPWFSGVQTLLASK